MHEIERVAEQSTSESEDGQCAHRGDKQAKPSPLNFASRRLLSQFECSNAVLSLPAAAGEGFRSLDATRPHFLFTWLKRNQ